MIDDGVVVALTPEELKSLLLVARDENFQFYVLALVTVCHGLRVSEAIALRRSNFSVSAGRTFLAVKRLKGSKATNQRLIVTPNALLNEKAVVAEYIADLGPSDLLFRDEHGEKFTRFHINYLMKSLGKLADIPEHKRFPHCLKHTKGILMRQSGVKLEEIQEAPRPQEHQQYSGVPPDNARRGRCGTVERVRSGCWRLMGEALEAGRSEYEARRKAYGVLLASDRR